MTRVCDTLCGYKAINFPSFIAGLLLNFCFLKITFISPPFVGVLPALRLIYKARCDVFEAYLPCRARVNYCGLNGRRLKACYGILLLFFFLLCHCSWYCCCCCCCCGAAATIHAASPHVFQLLHFSVSWQRLSSPAPMPVPAVKRSLGSSQHSFYGFLIYARRMLFFSAPSCFRCFAFSRFYANSLF